MQSRVYCCPRTAAINRASVLGASAMTLKLWQVDAFANKPLEGNPAAIVPLEKFLDAGLMQKIANENNLAETAYFVKTAPGRYDLRWFTPESEVDLCGHATLASAWVVFHELDPSLRAVAFETRPATLHRERAGARLESNGPQRGIEFMEHHPRARQRRVPAQIDFAFRREPAQIVSARRGLHEIGSLCEIVLIGDFLH